jgi:hypothetical protein
MMMMSLVMTEIYDLDGSSLDEAILSQSKDGALASSLLPHDDVSGDLCRKETVRKERK